LEILQAPAVSPLAAGSLLAAADTPQAPLARVMLSGYRAAPCSGWRLATPVNCGDAEDVDHGAGDRGSTVTAMPFMVETEDECTTIGTTVADREASARARLAAVESAAIAHELWTGELADATAGADAQSPWLDNVRLASTDAVDLTPAGGAVDPVAGLALLEQALADTLAGPVGLVHGTRQALTHLAGMPFPVRTEGNLLLTPFGTRLVGDAGYPGTGPDGAAPDDGEAWLYATARPTIRRGPIDVVPGDLTAIRPPDNTIRVTANRLVAVLLACGVHAVRITLT
jgi:hypothetical protein